jgi:hypothetical protein
LLKLDDDAIAHVEELKALNTRLPDMLKSVEEETAKAKEFARRSAKITEPFTTIVDWFSFARHPGH